MSWAAKKEYVQTKYQRADKRMYELNRDLAVAFEYWGCGLTRAKLLKIIRELRQQFAMGTKNILLETKAKLHFGNRRIH